MMMFRSCSYPWRASSSAPNPKHPALSAVPTIVVEVHPRRLPDAPEKLRIPGSRAAPPQATPMQT